MSTNENLKQLHERAVVERFVQWHNNCHSTQLAVAGRRVQPDFEVIDQNQEVNGIEVTTAYYDDQDAKGLWNLVRGKSTRFQSSLMVNPDQKLAGSISELLAKKCSKYGIASRVVLLIDIRAPVTDCSDIERSVIPYIGYPDSVPFRAIYLIDTQGSDTHVWCLHPKVTNS